MEETGRNLDFVRGQCGGGESRSPLNRVREVECQRKKSDWKSALLKGDLVFKIENTS